MFVFVDSGVLDSLRKPAYTGVNRCYPCTAVNLVLTLGLGLAVAVVSPPLAGVAVLLSLASIYLRGYLVPGTPALTKRYLPKFVLAWFGKTTETQRTTSHTTSGPRLTTDIGSESLLREAGALETATDGDSDATGSKLTSEFHAALQDCFEADRAVGATDGVQLVFGEDVSTTGVGDELTAVVDGQRLVGWESDAALRADIAASSTLRARWDGWDELSGPERLEFLSTLRAYLELCPVCAGSVELTDTLQESCCGPTQRTITANCSACGAVLLDATESV